jgi:hypothetical protein
MSNYFFIAPYTSSVDRLIPIVFVFVTVIGTVVATFVVTVTAAAETSAAVATATAAFVVTVTAAVTTSTVAAVTTTAVTTATTIAAATAVATATTVAAAATAVATATTVAAAAATKTTSSTAATFTWFGFLTYYRVTVKVCFVQCINCGLRLIVVWHLNEAEASGFARVVVHDNFCGINFPKSFECFSQVFTRCPEIEFCNKNVHLKKIKE